MAHHNEVNDSKLNSLTWTNYLNVVLLLTFRLPFAILQTVFSPFIHNANGYNDKPLKRRIGDALMRTASIYLPTPIMQHIVGSGLDQYRRWAAKYQPELGTTVEELPMDFDGGRGEQAHLFWIGPKRTEKVILYFPGGIYMFPVTEMMLKFWRNAQSEWSKQGLEVSVVVLSYSVGSDPDAAFPIQLFQATQALRHLFSIGCKPSDIQIVGDSAGGNLVTQLLSHMVHPFPLPSFVPPLHLPPGIRLRGACMISPWVGLSDPDQWGSTLRTKDYDVTVHQNLREAGEHYINAISNINIPHELSQLIPYAEPVLAPDDWYLDLQNSVVDRVLVTAGKEERLFDQIEVFFRCKIKPYHSDAILLVQGGGIHDDIIMDFEISETPLRNELTPVVLEWMAEGFRM
ncbi:Alpha/Beta hydrolase protein [Lentinula detonsa]|uniref:Alpha/Beta hydrolase protein n=1 Tax=Lentinula detonsa TaxID=2804962 RepID=A0AA38UXX5_9AGAR|nr:Alpha/Beta hydrolase protein [Lentinula detonsa]